MFIKIFVLLFLIFLNKNCIAEDINLHDINLENKLGIKIANFGTPFNLRYWINNDIGVEIGANLKSYETHHYYQISQGYLLKIYSLKNILFEIIPLFHYNLYSDVETTEGDLSAKLFFMTEFFFEEISPDLSFSAGIGIQMSINPTFSYDRISLIDTSPFLLSCQYYF